MSELIAKIRSCKLCITRFSATHTRHSPRPVAWFCRKSKVLIAGQAPGLKVHESGKPFTDRSGDRLRDWLGVSHDEFYDTSKFGIVPMAFCFPGYNAAGHDLAPPKICANTWRDDVLRTLQSVELTILIGSYAQNWHLNDGKKMSTRLTDWRNYGPDTFVLPHPSWRNNAWIKRNPWFEADLLPALRASVKKVISDG